MTVDWMVVATFLIGIATLLLAYITYTVSKTQERITGAIAQAQISAQNTAEQTRIAASREITASQEQLSRRQAIFPLWEYMSSLDEIDPTEPILPDVLKAVNTLELVALCVEGRIVDEQVILRTFRDIFKKFYEDIALITTKMDKINKSGTDLLNENRAAQLFYERLKKEDLERDRITNTGTLRT